jgi:hypothetical protein
MFSVLLPITLMNLPSEPTPVEAIPNYLNEDMAMSPYEVRAELPPPFVRLGRPAAVWPVTSAH